MSNNEEIFRKRLIELADRAYRTGVSTFTPFMGLLEQNIFKYNEKEFGHINYILFGGTDNCERVMVGFGDNIGRESFPIVCLKAVPTSKKYSEKLTHRDILGAIMNLGIERDTVGDIIINEDVYYIFCIKTMATHIMENLTVAKHTKLKLEQIDEPPVEEVFKLKRININIASTRLDCVIKEYLHIGRNKVASIIEQELVFIDGKMCKNCATKLSGGEIITVRGSGRFIFVEVFKETKKGRMVAGIDIYN